jgi:hypothetical protein
MEPDLGPYTREENLFGFALTLFLFSPLLALMGYLLTQC